MPKFWIRYDGIQSCENKDWEEIEVKNEDEATLYAWESACQDYESYEGLHGIPSAHDIEEELIEQGIDYTDEEVWDAYSDARESWISYEVSKTNPCKE
jgi:beta-xylosidase